MTDKELINQLKRSARLPSQPGTALQILEICQSDDVSDVSILKLSEALAADPALSVRLLKYANSSLLGASHEITTVKDAVVRLGIQTVRLMALSFSLVSTSDTRACRNFDFGRFWSHSLACAVAARHLAEQSRVYSREEAFAAGLLSHIGKMVLAIGVPDKYEEVLDRMGGIKGDTRWLEQLVFGSPHESIGATLLEEWGIPPRLVDAVRYYRSPEEVLDDAELRGYAEMIGHACDLAGLIGCELSEPEQAERRQLLLASPFFDVDEQIDEVTRGVEETLAELVTALQLEDPAAVDVQEIRAEAGEVLGELSLAAQLKTEAIEQENSGLQQQAFTDGLTSIANRAAFDDQLNKMWADALAKRQSIGLVMIDVDHFKNFNDKYGHQTGDVVLQSVAQCIPRAVRSVDFVARYGGEEFVVVMPNVDRLTEAQICVKIRTTIEANVVEREGQRLHVTASLGAAILPVVGPPLSPRSLLDLADRQLYVSKSKGRNCCSMKELRGGQALPSHAVSS